MGSMSPDLNRNGRVLQGRNEPRQFLWLGECCYLMSCAGCDEMSVYMVVASDAADDRILHDLT